MIGLFNGRRKIAGMESSLAPVFFRNSYCERGFYVSFSEPTILQIVGGDTSGTHWQTVPGHNPGPDKGTGCKECRANKGWQDRFLHFAKKLRISRWFKSRRGPSGDKGTSGMRGTLSVFHIQNYAGREGGAFDCTQQQGSIRLRTYLPQTDERGCGVCDSKHEMASNSRGDHRRGVNDNSGS